MSEPRCPYCNAPDNGTCAYPSESKPGCWQVVHRELDEKIAEQIRRIARHMAGDDEHR